MSQEKDCLEDEEEDEDGKQGSCKSAGVANEDVKLSLLRPVMLGVTGLPQLPSIDAPPEEDEARWDE